MNLKYRGISYQADSTNVQIATMENNPKILKFRGSSYLANNSYINIPKSTQENIVYRGVAVATGKKINFLGRSTEQTKVVLQPVIA